MKAFWIYTGMRLLIFVASFSLVAGVWLLIADELQLLYALLLAMVISAVASYKLLAAQRETLAAQIQSRADRAASRFEEMRAKEDGEPEA